MSQVVTGVTQKLQDILPGQIGTNRRWSTSDVERYIMLADRAVRERAGNRIHEQEISLVADQLEYTLDSEFINIVSVEYASDGSTYDYYLTAKTLDDLDKVSLKWRSDGGTRPDRYVVLGTPGTPTCKVLIYPKMSSVDSQTIRVTGCGIGTTTTDVPDDVQELCHVPFVMSILKAHEDPQEAFEYLKEYEAGVDEVAARTQSRLSESPMRVRFGW